MVCVRPGLHTGDQTIGCRRLSRRDWSMAEFWSSALVPYGSGDRVLHLGAGGRRNRLAGLRASAPVRALGPRAR